MRHAEHWGFDSGMTEDALWERLLAVFAERLHVTSALYGFVPNLFWLEEGQLSHALVVRHNHPPGVLGTHHAEALLDDDPCALRLVAGEPWFFWHRADEWSGASAAQALRQASGDESGNVGVSISLPFFEGRAMAGLGLCAQGTAAEAFAAAWMNGLAEHLAIARAFDAVMRPKMIANRFKLSKREISVLRLLASGLSAKGIAEHLKLSPKTVFNVMDRTRKSLHADTTLEAVTKALAYRLI